MPIIPLPIQLTLPFEGPTKLCARCQTAKPHSDFGIDRARKDLRNPYCKACKAIISTASKIKNRESIAAYNAAYKRTHRAESAAWAREYRAKHNERLRPIWRANRAQEYAQFPDRVREQAKQSAARHADRVREYNHHFYRANKEVFFAANRRRRARKRNAEGSHTLQEWQAVKQAQDYCCLRCKRQEPEILLTVDHVIPLCKGGTNYISNIQGLCKSCNCAKHVKTTDYRV